MYFKEADKEMISESLKLAKTENCERFFCKDEKLVKNFQMNVEELAFFFDNDKTYLRKNFNSDYLVKLNLDIGKIKNFYETNKSVDLEMDLVRFNIYFNSMINPEEEASLEEKYTVRLTYYIYHIYSKLLVYISLNPNFCFLETMKKEFITFFRNFIILIKRIKTLENKLNRNELSLKKSKSENMSDIKINLDEIFSKKKSTHNSLLPIPLNDKDYTSYLLPFEEIQNYKSEFGNIINNYQNFLTLLLFQIAENYEEIGTEYRTYDVLKKFIKVFKYFYKVNEKFKISNFRDFYNDSVSNYLNLKEECQNYISILNKRKNSDSQKEPFSLIKFHFLFDAAAKSDILYIFNFHQQRQEMINSISDIMNLQMNRMDLRGIYLFLEIKRNNLIEDTLNFISNSQLNFKKQLKVKFIGEQGVDEGGVKKEFFLLLVRQLFDLDYGMFTYNSKNRFFWFNPVSFEPKIKFELIGVILGLAFFNNVILDIKFPLVIYKKILGIKISLYDLLEIDIELHNNLKFLLETEEKNLRESLDTNFTVILDRFGEKVNIPLKVNGT
jgi:hypothetical protein